MAQNSRQKVSSHVMMLVLGKIELILPNGPLKVSPVLWSTSNLQAACLTPREILLITFSIMKAEWHCLNAMFISSFFGNMKYFKGQFFK